MDRHEELRRATRPRKPAQKQQRATDLRRQELMGALGVGHLKPGETYQSKVDAVLHKGKVVGPPWMGGIFQTRLNIGTLVLAFGFILFIVWLIMKRSEMGG